MQGIWEEIIMIDNYEMLFLLVPISVSVIFLYKMITMEDSFNPKKVYSLVPHPCRRCNKEIKGYMYRAYYFYGGPSTGGAAKCYYCIDCAKEKGLCTKESQINVQYTSCKFCGILFRTDAQICFNCGKSLGEK